MSYTWSEECTNALLEYEGAGVIHVTIARLLNEQFGTSYNKSSVCKKLIRLRTPKQARRDSSVFWLEPMKARLREFYQTSVSFTDIANALNKEFNTSYSRASVIGCSRRLGLKGKTPAPSTSRTPRIRIVAANSNSNRKRIIQAVENKETIVLRCVEITPRGLSLINLEPGDCRYPYGDETITFCGHQIKEGSSYCIAHHHLCWVKPLPPKHKAFVREAA